MDERKGHYTPAQFGAFLKVQLLAGRQSKPGRFRSIDALRAILPAAYVRHVDFLLAEGDVVIQESGVAYVDGWDEWQEGDLTVGDRMARLRNRRRNGAVTPPVTPPVTTPSPPAIGIGVGVSIGVGGATAPPARAGLPNLTPEAIALLESKTGYLASQAGDKQLTEYDRLVGAHPLPDIHAAFTRLNPTGKAMTARQLVWGAVKVLEPFIDAKALAADEHEQAEAEASRRRREASMKQLHALGGHEGKPRAGCPVCQEQGVTA
jgi:hypothetical protein